MSDRTWARPRRLGALAASGCLALGAACAVGPDYERPTPPTVRGYVPAEPKAPEAAQVEAQRVQLGEQVPAQWWKLLHSPRLDEQMRRSIAANPSIAAARATLLEAREAIVQASAGLYPQLTLNAGAQRTAAKSTLSNVVFVRSLFSVGPVASFL